MSNEWFSEKSMVTFVCECMCLQLESFGRKTVLHSQPVWDLKRYTGNILAGLN